MSLATHIAPGQRARRRWSTYAKFAASWVLVVSIGKFVVPTRTDASPTTGPRLAPADIAPALGPSLGTIVGPDYRVRIHAGVAEPLFTVLSADGTSVVRTGLTSLQLAQRFPTLNPARLNATPESPGAEPLRHAAGDE